MRWHSRATVTGMLVLFVTSACGGPATGSGTSSTARIATTASPQPARSDGSLLVIASLDSASSMSLRFVDARGRVKASTQFAPPPRPAYGPCADLLQPPVRVARGAAYFADSSGAVRRMAPDGTITAVTAFPLANKQQALSFAVSPDGSQLIAIILSTPPLHNPPPQTLGDPLFDPGTWSLDLETAVAGGTAAVVLHRNLSSLPPSPTVITGWDQSGPTATLNTAICTQNVVPSTTYNGTLIHLALDGTHLDRIGGADCNAWDELADGTVLCGANNWQAFSVRRNNGDVVWSRAGSDLWDVRLSPDGNGVATGGGAVFLRDTAHAASSTRLGGTAGRILGWADAGRVVTITGDRQLGIASVSTSPLMVMNLGLTFTSPCPGCAPDVSLIGTLG